MAKKKDFQRARTPEQQAQRRQEILTASYQLFYDLDYEDVSLNAIAREAGLSKSSVYLYFKTREEILMEIFFDMLRQWVEESLTLFGTLPDGTTAQELADAWTELLWSNEQFGAIAPLVSASLEHHVSDEVLAACFHIKTEASDRFREVLSRFVELSREQSFELLINTLSLYAQYITYQHNEGMTRVLEQTEFNWIQCDYRALAAHLLALWIENVQKNQGDQHEL